MKITPGTLFAFLLFWAGWAGLQPLPAQDGLLTLNPPLTDVFPLENLPDGVHLNYPVMLNDHTVLEPSAILRFVFLDPNGAAQANAQAADGGPGFRSHAGAGNPLTRSAEESDPNHDTGQVGGWGTAGDSDAKGLFDEKKEDAKRRKTELQTEVWRSKDLFYDALGHATQLGTVLVYSLPSKAAPQTTSLDLPEGMLLGEIDGHVRVLGLEESSRAFAGGIRPGDEIRAFQTGAPLKSLYDFMRDFMDTKHHARVAGTPVYAMEIWRPSSSQTITVQIAAPPTIPSFLNDTYTAPQEQKQ